MFVALTLVSVIPVVLMLFVGMMTLREVVMSTGSAGAWDEVAESGRDLFDRIEAEDSLPPELSLAVERHAEALNESVRFSRLYAFVGERILVLLPALALMLLSLVGGLALVAANRFAKDFSRPVEELVGLTRSLASGERLPPSAPHHDGQEITEFTQLREALHTTAEELRQARRKELEQARIRSWAEMARMIAHELKNPLTPMAMAADRVARAQDPDIALAGEVLRGEIARLDDLARTFAHFGRPPEGPMSSIDVGEMLASVVGQLDTQGMRVRFDAPPEPTFVRGHLLALERVVRNLLANAQDAVDARARSEPAAGGRGLPQVGDGTTVSATGEPRVAGGRQEEPVTLALSREDGSARITVKDRGTGIPSELLDRIWEPEFTMKGKGTGLGLPMVRQVVEAHGGRVAAVNRPEGPGAEFSVWLPLQTGFLSTDPASSEQDPTASGSDPRVTDLQGTEAGQPGRGVRTR